MSESKDPITEALWSDGGILDQISAERRRQHAKWGEQNHKDGTSVRNKDEADYARSRCDMYARMGHVSWALILTEEFWEALSEEDPAKLREELLQVASVAVAWVEAIDRRAR